MAVRLAQAFGSQVTLLHVEEPIASWPVAWHDQEAQAARLMQQLSEQLVFEKVSVKALPIGMGPPADLIIRKANEIDADLILIGTGELSRFGRYSAGPVTEAVMQRAVQPVLAIRPEAPTAKFSNILCPVDFSAPSKRGLQNSIRLAKAFRGHLLVMTVVPKAKWLGPAIEAGRLAGAPGEYDRQWREQFDRFIEDVEFDEVSWEKEARCGLPDQEIVAAAREHHSDVIVMGSTGRTGLARVLMGSVARRVLQQLPCSLLTVKNEDLVEEISEEEASAIHQLLTEGRGQLGRGDYEPALAKFNQVLAHNPFHIAALEGRAVACERLGQVDRAERCRRRVERIRQMSAT